MRAIVAVLGFILVAWGYWEGFRLREGERAAVFYGSLGCLFNLVVVVGGLAMLGWGILG
jgi:hypothetical protein